MSNPLGILVVDDEDLARRKIIRYLSGQEANYTVAEATNGLEALERIADFAPEIVFLDVQMPGLTGFDVLYHLEARPFQIIFQTAFDEFALKAFEENACDYLLKPFSRERFDKALKRATDQIAGHRPSNLEASLINGAKFLTKLSVKAAGILSIIEVTTVDCFVSRDHYTCIHLTDKEYLSELSLSRLETTLDPAQFVRIHRNSVINVHSVTKLTRAGDDMVTLKNGMELPVSRRNRARLVEMLG